jgi:hypothetical protein
MKYWAYLAAKLVAAFALLRLVWLGIETLLPEPQIFLYTRLPRFPHDLPWTAAILLFWLFAVGLLVVVIWDQRIRCRTCLRRLRMPVESGSWSRATLFAPPRKSLICPYGHGTLDEPVAHVSAQPPAEWHRHPDNIWEELEALDKDPR